MKDTNAKIENESNSNVNGKNKDKDLVNKNSTNGLKRQIKRKEIFLKRDEIEKKIFEIFPVLNNEGKFHDFFSSYDFHEDEVFILNFWKDILEYLIIHLKDDFSINYSQLISLTRFKCETPIGLPNIIKKLVKDGDFLLASELKSEEYYKSNFPSLYPKDTWGQYFKKAITNTIWGSSSDFSREISNDEIIIEKKAFLHHLDILMELLRTHCEENDQNVLTYSELKDLIFNNEEQLHYLDSNIDLCLLYLSKTKKISIFESNFDDQQNIKCIKLLNSPDDTVSIKDQALIKLSSQIRLIEKRIHEQESEIQDLTIKTKTIIKSGDKDKAKKILNKRLMLKNNLNNFYNIKDVLFEKLLSIKSMEATKNIQNTLEEVLKTCDKLKVDLDQIQNIKENYEEIKYQNKEVKDLFVNYAEENSDKDYIENELNALYKNMEISEKNDNKVISNNKNLAKKERENISDENNFNKVVDVSAKNIENSHINEIENLLQELNN